MTVTSSKRTINLASLHYEQPHDSETLWALMYAPFHFPFLYEGNVRIDVAAVHIPIFHQLVQTSKYHCRVPCSIMLCRRFNWAVWSWFIYSFFLLNIHYSVGKMNQFFKCFHNVYGWLVAYMASNSYIVNMVTSTTNGPKKRNSIFKFENKDSWFH